MTNFDRVNGPIHTRVWKGPRFENILKLDHDLRISQNWTVIWDNGFSGRRFEEWTSIRDWTSIWVLSYMLWYAMICYGEIILKKTIIPFYWSIIFSSSISLLISSFMSRSWILNLSLSQYLQFIHDLYCSTEYNWFFIHDLYCSIEYNWFFFQDSILEKKSIIFYWTI